MAEYSEYYKKKYGRPEDRQTMSRRAAAFTSLPQVRKVYERVRQAYGDKRAKELMNQFFTKAIKESGLNPEVYKKGSYIGPLQIGETYFKEYFDPKNEKREAFVRDLLEKPKGELDRGDEGVQLAMFVEKNAGNLTDLNKEYGEHQQGATGQSRVIEAAETGKMTIKKNEQIKTEEDIKREKQRQINSMLSNVLDEYREEYETNKKKNKKEALKKLAQRTLEGQNIEEFSSAGEEVAAKLPTTRPYSEEEEPKMPEGPKGQTMRPEIARGRAEKALAKEQTMKQEAAEARAQARESKRSLFEKAKRYLQGK